MREVHSHDFYRIICFVPFTYKKGLIKTMIDGTFRINNTCGSFHLDFEKLKVILQKSKYRPNLIDKSVKNI